MPGTAAPTGADTLNAIPPMPRFRMFTYAILSKTWNAFVHDSTIRRNRKMHLRLKVSRGMELV